MFPHKSNLMKTVYGNKNTEFVASNYRKVEKKLIQVQIIHGGIVIVYYQFSLPDFQIAEIHEEIELLRSIAFKRFYSRPRFVLRKLLGVRSRDDLKMVTGGLKSLFWIWVKKDLFRLRGDKNKKAS